MVFPCPNSFEGKIKRSAEARQCLLSIWDKQRGNHTSVLLLWPKTCNYLIIQHRTIYGHSGNKVSVLPWHQVILSYLKGTKSISDRWRSVSSENLGPCVGYIKSGKQGENWLSWISVKNNSNRVINLARQSLFRPPCERIQPSKFKTCQAPWKWCNPII